MTKALLGNHNKTKSSTSSKKDKIFFYALIILPLVQFLVFYVYVNFNSILLSFQKYDSSSAGFIFLTDNVFKNYQGVFELGSLGLDLGKLILNSVILWVCMVAFGTIPAIIFSFYIYRKRTLYHFFKFFLFLPSIIPSILLTTVFKGFMIDCVSNIMSMLGTTFKTSNGLLDPYSDTAFPILLIYYIWISFGAQVLFYSNAMAQTSPSLVEASQLDGCGEGRILLHVVLPGIMPTVKTFIIASIAGLFTNQMLLFNFYGTIDNAPNIATIGYFIYSMAAPGPSNYDNYPLMSAFGLLCSIIAISAIFVINKIFKRFEK
jgi:ABC-type sugar transport system permease subunit